MNKLSFGETIVVFFVSLPASIYRAWLLTIMWGWFFVKLFGLPPIPLFGMLGILYFLSVVHIGMAKDKDDFDGLGDVIAHIIGKGVVAPTFVLGISYVLTLFM